MGFEISCLLLTMILFDGLLFKGCVGWDLWAMSTSGVGCLFMIGGIGLHFVGLFGFDCLL